MALNRKAKAAIIIAAVLLVGGGCTAGVVKMANSISAVNTMPEGKELAKAEVRDVQNYVGVSGNVAGISSVKIAAPANSKVLELDTDLGSAVKKGDLLCVFDTEELVTQCESLKRKSNLSGDRTDDTHKINERTLREAVDEQKRQLADAQENIDKAKKEREKQYKKYNDEVKKYNEDIKKRDKLYDEVYAAEDYSTFKSKLDSYNEIEERVKAAKAQLDAMKETLSPYDDAITAAQKQYDSVKRTTDQSIQAVKDTINAEKYTEDDSLETQIGELEKQIAECEVKAPIDGVVSELGVTEGGLPEGKSIITIENTEKLKIKVSIKEKDILKLKEGMGAEITVDSIPDKTFKGKLNRVVLVPQKSMGEEGGVSSDYSAEIVIDDKDSGLLIGMNAKAKIILSEKKNTLAVPFDAVTEDSSGKKIVYIAEKQADNTVKARAAAVTVELEADYYVAVTSSEVKDGDTLILLPDDISDGDIVTVRADDYDFFGGEES